MSGRHKFKSGLSLVVSPFHNYMKPCSAALKPYFAALAPVNLVTLAFSDYAKVNGCSEMVVVVWQEYQVDSDIRSVLASVTGVVSVLPLALKGQKHHAFSRETVTTSTNECEICLIRYGVFTL